MAISALVLIGFAALNIALFWHFRQSLWRALLGPLSLFNAGAPSHWHPRHVGSEPPTPDTRTTRRW